jgi:hypothetical protein
MSEQVGYVQGFRTTNGVVKYDYNALANIPSVVKLLFCKEGSLPNPSASLVGTIALVDKNGSDIPFICFKNGE